MRPIKPLKQFEPLLYTHSRTELREILGVSYITLRRKLTGETDFTPSEIKKLQRQLGLSDTQTVDIFIR